MTVANVQITQVLLKRGNLERSGSYVGPLSELTHDTTLDTLRIHDSVTPGGSIIATHAEVEALANVVANVVVGNVNLTGYATETYVNNAIANVTATANTGNITFNGNTISTLNLGNDIVLEPQGDVILSANRNMILDMNAFTGNGIVLQDSTEDGYDDPNTPSTLYVGRIYHDTGTMVIQSDGRIEQANDPGNLSPAYGSLRLTNQDNSAGILISPTTTIFYNSPPQVEVTGNLRIADSGIIFADGTYQNTAAVPDTDTLDSVTSRGNATANGITVSSATADYIATNLTPNAAPVVTTGMIAWNSADNTFDMGLLNGVVLQAGQETHMYAKASENISNGQAVMFAGANGDNILIRKYDPTVPGFINEWFVGVAAQDLVANQFGYVTIYGKVHNLNTNAYQPGTILYADNTVPGGLTTTTPSPGTPHITVAAVTKQSGGDGHFMVRPIARPLLKDLSDIDADTPTVGQVLKFDGNVWVNADESAGGTTYTNANVAEYLASYDGGINFTSSPAIISGLGNISSANFTFANGVNILDTVVANAVTIPTLVSSFTNDAGYIITANLEPYATTANLMAFETWANVTFITTPYTDNNVAAYLTSQSIGAQIQSDYALADSGNVAYIKNKPDLSVYATQTDLSTAINNLIDSAPGTLDTLGEISANLAADANAVSAIINSITSTNSNVSTLSTNVSAYEIWANANAATQASYITTLQSQVYSNANVIANLTTLTTNINTTGNITGNTNGYAIGYRDIPQILLTTNTTLTPGDAGKHYYSTSGTNITLTVPTTAAQPFSIGAAVNIINQGAGNIIIAPAAGVSMYLAGNSIASARTLSSYGMATVNKVATDTWFIVGVGLA